MLKVTSHDYNFYKLVDYIQNPPSNPADLVSTLQAFRSRLSFRWIEPLLKEETAGCISSVLLTLFTHASSDDATVRINVYSALGAFLYSLTPFVPTPMMQGLMAAIVNCPVRSSSSSIAIISSFLYMVHYINPIDLDNFITNTPVLHHFSVDVSDFIKYVPHLVKLMKPLPKEFDQNFLRSLLTAFGRNPNRYFVESVVELLKLCPVVLLSDLMEFCIGNKLNQAILAFGSDLISSEELFGLLTDSYKATILDEAFTVLQQEHATLGDFEQATGILSAFIKKVEGEKLKELHEKISETTKGKNYPNHFRKFLLAFTDDINELKYCESDAGSLKVAKLKALTSILIKEESDKKMCKDIMNILKDYMSSNGDVLTAFINSISATFDILKEADKQSLSQIIEQILSLNDTTWVQNSAIVRLLTSIGLDDGCLLFDSFEKESLNMLLNFGMSMQEDLSKLAIEAIPSFTTYQNLEQVKRFLFTANVFEQEPAKHLIQILLKLVEIFPVSEFTMFSSIISEIPQIHSNPMLAGLSFEFLLKADYNGNADLSNCCLDWVSRLYKSIIQNDPPVSSPFKYDKLPYMITTIETDIVANDLIEQHSAAKPLLQCFKYLIKLQIHCIPFIKQIVRLFPNSLIPLADKCFPDKSGDEFIEFTKTVCEILTASSSLKSCAICARFLSTARADFKLQQTQAFIQYLNTPRALTAEQIAAFYSVVAFGDLKNAPEHLKQARGRVTDELQIMLLAIKLNEFDEEKMKIFAEKHPFEEWPITDADFVSFIETKLTQQITVKFNEGINEKHILFALSHEKTIKVENIDEFSQKHPKFMMKFRFTHQVKHFTYSPVVEECKLHSLCPELKNNSYTTKNLSLLRSFFAFSTYKVEQQVFDQIINENEDETLCLLLINYATRHGLSIKAQSMSRFAKTTNQKLLKAMCLTDEALESVIPGYKDKDLIEEMDMKKYTIINLAIKTNPTKYFKKFIETHKQKRKVFIKIIYFLSLYKVDPTVLDDYVLSCVQNPEIEEYSNKKMTALVRLVHAHFISMNPTAAAKNGAFFKAEFFNVLNNLISGACETVKKELARCLRYYYSARGPGPKILAELDEHERVYPRTPTYVECLARIFAFSASGARYKRGLLSDVLSLDLPSYKLSAMRCVHFLLQPHLGRHAWDTVYSCLSKVLNAAEFLAEIPVADQMVAAVLSSITRHPMFLDAKTETVSRSMKYIMRKPSSASFNLFLPLVKKMMSFSFVFVPQYSTYIENIVADPCPSFARAFDDYKEYRINIEKTKQGKEDVVLEHISRLAETFMKVQTIEAACSLAEGLAHPPSDFDSLSLIVGRLCMSPTFSLSMLVAVAKTLSADDKMANDFGTLIDDVKDSFPSHARYEALCDVKNKNYFKAIDTICDDI